MNEKVLLFLMITCFVVASFLSGYYYGAIILNKVQFHTDDFFPQSRISTSNVQLFPNKIIINYPSLYFTQFTHTHSMNPTLGYNSIGIYTTHFSKENLRVGDIISYELNNNSHRIINNNSHRIIKIGVDNKGWYCITKGDNNLFSDGKVRFEQIRGVCVGIIY